MPLPAPLLHANASASDADLAREVRGHHDAHAAVRFVADVLRAIHAPPTPLRSANDFYERFPARLVLDAFERRADLRARLLHAITGGPHALLRRMPPGDLATQIELLVEDDIPIEERSVRAEEYRLLSVPEIYQKMIDPVDLCTYVALRDLWAYEHHDAWWTTVSDVARRMLVAEIKSIRRHRILSDTEILDRIGNETLEDRLPLAVRTQIRAASRKAAADGRPFSDTDMFECTRAGNVERDLVDEFADCVPALVLRAVIERAAEVLQLATSDGGTTVVASVPSLVAATASATPSARTSPAVSPSVRPAPMAPGAQPSFSPTPSVRPPALPGASSALRGATLTGAAGTPAAARPAPASLPAAREPPAPAFAAAPLVPLAEDESFGAESTNNPGGGAPRDFDDSATTQVTKGPGGRRR